MGVNNLFRKRKGFMGGGMDMGGVDAPDRDNDGKSDREGNKDLADAAAASAAATNAFNEGLNNNNNTNNTTNNTTTTTEEEKPGFFQSVFDFFSDLAPTQEEQFAQDWDKLASWEKKKALSPLGITADQITGDVMSALNDYHNMSFSEIQDAISGFGISDLFSNPFKSGTLGVGYSMLDMFNPFTDTQYNLQDPNNWTGAHPSNNMVGTYTGNVASLNSAQLADLANQQMGGLTSTQLGQALAGAVDDAETRDATRGPDYPTVNNMNDQNVELTDSAKQIADLISRGFSEAMAERIVDSGKYFASYDE